MSDFYEDERKWIEQNAVNPGLEAQYLRERLRLALERAEAAEAKLARALPYDVRQWYYYPIEMPLTKGGQGPAKIGVDADRVSYEVWDVLLNSYASFDNLPDAINESMRLNSALAKLKGQTDE